MLLLAIYQFNYASDTMLWSVINPNDRQPPKPAADHSSRNDFGNFLTTKLNGEDKDGAELNAYFSFLDTNFGPHCLNFWYIRESDNDDELQFVYLPYKMVRVKAIKSLLLRLS